MPMTVIALKNVPPSLRGDLTRWMQEISTGVYVGNFNSKVRELLWRRVTETAGTGEAILCFSSRNELGYDFQTYNTDRKVIDYDGIPLVLIPAPSTLTSSDKLHSGFSKASKIHAAKKNIGHISKSNDYVVIDLETTSLDYRSGHILEIGAVKQEEEKVTYFHKLIQQDSNVPKEIKDLTGITDDLLKKEGISLTEALKEFVSFVGSSLIVGYNVNFDMNYLNNALIKENMSPLQNKVRDLIKTIKSQKPFQMNYKLETSLKSYGIEAKVPHRALEDAKLTFALAAKVNKFDN